jgi:hypothetical protein
LQSLFEKVNFTPVGILVLRCFALMFLYFTAERYFLPMKKARRFPLPCTLCCSLHHALSPLRFASSSTNKTNPTNST